MGNRVCIIGGGSWGTALAQLLARNGHQPLIYLRDKEQRDNINNFQINQRYFPNHLLPVQVKATLDPSSALSVAAFVFLVVPTYATREVMEKIAPFLQRDQVIISTAKGFEEVTYLRNSEIIKQYCRLPVAVLSGPTHAEEVIKGLPTAVVVAATERDVASNIQNLMMSNVFRVYTNPDLIGVEIGGAIKNIIALAAGISDGLGYGDNARAALITRGLYEMSRLGVYIGGRLLTFAGLTGMGDLVVTCNSMYSRNRRLGILIGKGYSLTEALKEINQVVEGVRTVKAVYEWYRQEDFNLELPITQQIYQVLFNNKDPLQAVNDLMLRGPKQEI
jgi:glycerol-3-phosphate dehydrogenase (NAD(P)+)